MKTKLNAERPIEGDGNGDGLWDKLDVAQRLGISVGMVDKLRRTGKLLAVKLGRSVRFEPAEVKRFVEREREGRVKTLKR